jgi:hypothetical protein
MRMWHMFKTWRWPVKLSRHYRPHVFTQYPLTKAKHDLGVWVKMSATNLRKQILPIRGENASVRSTLGEELMENVFATIWDHRGLMVCWITQYCAKKEWIRKLYATKVVHRVFGAWRRRYIIWFYRLSLINNADKRIRGTYQCAFLSFSGSR